jgi:hypothetical protein
LDDSLGFTLESRDGPIGTIEEVLLGPDGSSETLIVRSGHGTVVVPVQRVAKVLPDAKRVLLANGSGHE